MSRLRWSAALPGGTDLPVLLPSAHHLARSASAERASGLFTLRLQSVHGVALLAHLSDDAGLLCHYSHLPDFVNRMSQRLLTIYMQPAPHRRYALFRNALPLSVELLQPFLRMFSLTASTTNRRPFYA